MRSIRTGGQLNMTRPSRDKGARPCTIIESGQSVALFLPPKLGDYSSRKSGTRRAVGAESDPNQVADLELLRSVARSSRATASRGNICAGSLRFVGNGLRGI